MILQYLLLISAFFILTNAAAIEPNPGINIEIKPSQKPEDSKTQLAEANNLITKPVDGILKAIPDDETYTTLSDVILVVDVSKQLPKPKDTEEILKINDTSQSRRTEKIDTPELKQEIGIDVTKERESTTQRTIKQEDNELGHETKINLNSADNTYVQRSYDLTSESPSTYKHAVRDTKIESQQEINKAETEQLLDDGSVYTQNKTSKLEKNQHSEGSVREINDDDSTSLRIETEKDKVKIIDKSDNIIQRKINGSSGDTEITRSDTSTNTENYDYSFTEKNKIQETPDDYQETKTTYESGNYENDNVKEDTTEVVHKTPNATIKITDVNRKENDEKVNYNERDSTKYIEDNDGNTTIIKESDTKDTTDNTLENTNTLTIEAIPESEEATPLTISLTSTSLDGEHYEMKSTHEKTIKKETEDGEIIEKKQQKSKVEYDLHELKDDRDDGDEDCGC